MRPTVTIGRGLAGALAAIAIAATAADPPPGGGHAGETAEAAEAPAPRWTLAGAPGEGGYRWALSRGALGVGLRFEGRPAASHPLDARLDSAAPPGATWPALSIGLSEVEPAPAPASSLVERALGSPTALQGVRRVGIQWKPAQSQLFLKQGLGLRLSGDDRVTMRLRKGSLGLYMQRTF